MKKERKIKINSIILVLIATSVFSMRYSIADSELIQSPDNGYFGIAPTAHWNMEDIESEMLIDRISGKQMTLINGAYQGTPGKFGANTLKLDNPDQLDIANRQIGLVSSAGNGADIEDIWTISFWYKPDRVNYERGFTSILTGLKNGVNYDGGGWVINHEPENGFGYTLQQWKAGDMADWIWQTWTSHQPTPNVWDHVVMVRNMEIVHLYINGVLQPGSEENLPTGYAPSANTLLVIGTDPLDEAATPGEIDEIQIFQGIALSDQQVENLFRVNSTGATIDDILTFFNDGVEADTIEGSGNWPRIANYRLYFFRLMLKAAKWFIENDFINAACRTLNRAHLRCDGEPWPIEFIEGEAVPQLADMILNLMEFHGCE